jgi:hypothetical protein
VGLAEVRAHGADAQVRLLAGVGQVVRGEAAAAVEAEGLDELDDTVVVAQRELLPLLGGVVELAAVAVLDVAPDELVVTEWAC